MSGLHVIQQSEVAEILQGSVLEVYQKIKQAYIMHGEQQTVCPRSYFLRYPDNLNTRIIALPAHIGGEYNRSGIKWIGSNPSNLEKGIPRASAVYILNDGETKRPLACIESSIISSTRTAYSTVLATEQIKNSKTIDTLSFIGLGPIAKSIYKAFIDLNWEIENILCYDLNAEASLNFSEYVKNNSLGCTVKCVSCLDDAMRNEDTIVFATTAMNPYISKEQMRGGGKTILHVSLRDIKPEAILEANNIVDDIQHILHANTSIDLASKLSGDNSFINGTLAEMISNKIKLDRSRTTVFSPMGLGILDLIIADYIYNEARSEGLGISIPDFMSD